jgi:CRP/FNR family transcriptional regulator, cyclic AMP receptor protein
MKLPYGLEIIENCVECKLRQGFCDLPTNALAGFSALGHQHTYPGGSVLFMEGQQARGAYVLCSGKVKLSTTSREGKILILKMACPGEVLGLSAVISNRRYEVTATTAAPCRVNFVHGDALIGFLRRHGEAGLRAAQAVSKEYQDACLDIQEILLAPSSAGKLAKLLLSWTNGNHGDREVRVRTVGRISFINPLSLPRGAGKAAAVERSRHFYCVLVDLQFPGAKKDGFLLTSRLLRLSAKSGGVVGPSRPITVQTIPAAVSFAPG